MIICSAPDWVIRAHFCHWTNVIIKFYDNSRREQQNSLSASILPLWHGWLLMLPCSTYHQYIKRKKMSQKYSPRHLVNDIQGMAFQEHNYTFSSGF
jgi:hypothetical protein